MNKLRLLIKNSIGGGITRVIITSLIATLTCTGIIYAATTVGTNISTTGTITGSGTNTLYGATSIGGAITATSTLTVSGLTTLGNASTTLLSVSGNLDFATASSTGIVKFSQINSDTGNINFGDDNLYTTGNIGIGTSSPYAKLSVVGEIVGSYFTATSTTATSTFAGNILIGTGTPSITVNGGDAYVTDDLDVGGDIIVKGYTFEKDENNNIVRIKLKPLAAITDYGASSATAGTIEWAAAQFNQPTWVAITDITNVVADSGTQTSATSYKLTETDQNFTSTVVAGMVARDTSAALTLGRQWAVVEAVDSDTVLSLSRDVFTATETHSIEWLRITAAGHGLVDGDTVYIRRTLGMREINNAEYKVFNVSGDTFGLWGIKGDLFTAYTSGGQLRKVSDGEVIGGEIVLGCGNYQQQSTITLTEDNIKISSESPKCARIYADPSRACENRTATQATACSNGYTPFEQIIIKGDNNTIDGIEVDGSVSSGDHQIIIMGKTAGDVAFAACDYWNYNTKVINSYVHDSRTDGIVSGPCAKNVKVDRNTVFGHHNPNDVQYDEASSLEVEDGAEDVTVSNNTVYKSDNCSYPHIHSTANSIKNLKLISNTCVGGGVDNSTDIQVANASATNEVDIEIISNTIDGGHIMIGGTGIVKAKVDDNTVKNTKAWTSNTAVLLNNTNANSDISLDNNVVVGCGTDTTCVSTGIYISGGTKYRLNHNSISGIDLSSSYPIRINDGTSAHTVTNNIVTLGGTQFAAGIYILGDNMLLDGNVVNMNQNSSVSSYGVYNTSTATGNTWRNNTIYNNNNSIQWRNADTTNSITQINNHGDKRVLNTNVAITEIGGDVHLKTAAIVQSLGNAPTMGQKIRIVADDVVGGNHVITIPAWDKDINDLDNDTCTFDAANEYIYLEWDLTKWVTLSSSCTITAD